MDVTMKDVAKLAGVSPSTVSRVINNSTLVKEDTARKVRMAIKKLNYQVNDSARALRTNNSRLIGIIGAGMEKPFLSKVLKGIETEAWENNYNILYCNSDGELNRELSYLDLMKQKKINGIILITANVFNSLLLEVKKSGIPVVFASGYIPDQEIVCVTVDNVKGAYDAVNYLIDKGHRQIGFIQGPYSDSLASAERIRGSRLAFQSKQMEFKDEHMVEGDYTYEGGYIGAKKLLRRNKNITAIFAFNDEMAVGAIRYIEDSGRNVPDDIEVVGFDNIDLSEYVKPSLTTVAQPGYELGSKSVQLLHRLISGEELEKKKVFVPHKLIVRGSTKGKLKGGGKRKRRVSNGHH